MYADEWSDCLYNLYCRRPHYLGDYKSQNICCQVRSYGEKEEGCEWIGDYSSNGYGVEDQIFRVEIQYIKETREITAFDVTREKVVEDSHFGTDYEERSISSENKKAFYEIFRPIITKEKPEIMIAEEEI